MLVEAVLLSSLTIADVKYLQMLAICFCYVFSVRSSAWLTRAAPPVLLTSNGLGLGSEPVRHSQDLPLSL